MQQAASFIVGPTQISGFHFLSLDSGSQEPVHAPPPGLPPCHLWLKNSWFSGDPPKRAQHEMVWMLRGILTFCINDPASLYSFPSLREWG